MRHKSPERIQGDIDKAIRKERRDRKLREREDRRKLRLEKRRVRERVAENGLPMVQSGGTELGIHDAIAFSPLIVCVGCGAIVRERDIFDELCEKCKYGEAKIDKSGISAPNLGPLFGGS